MPYDKCLIIGGPADGKMLEVEESSDVLRVPMQIDPGWIRDPEMAAAIETKEFVYVKKPFAMWEGRWYHLLVPEDWNHGEVIARLLNGYRPIPVLGKEPW